MLTEVTLPAGKLNTTPEDICAHVRSACARQLPQARPFPPNGQHVVLVGGGPSLASTFDELRAQVWAGAKVVAVNGAYRWLMDRNIHPSNMIMVDARSFNARFLDPPLPTCKYLLSSQCAPEAFDALEQAGVSDVWLFHSCGDQAPERALIDEYYAGHWHSVGGSTVMIQALSLLRMLGFLRIDVYGLDSCWLDDAHHAYPQAENDRERRMPVWLVPKAADGTPDETRKRQFWCAPWHMKQAEDFQRLLIAAGDSMLVRVHGDGLIAHMMATAAALITEEQTDGTHDS